MYDKPRHGCLLIWLIWMIISNQLAFITHIFLEHHYILGDAFGAATNDIRTEKIPLYSKLSLIVLFASNVVAAVGMLQWKKWGFWLAMGNGMLIAVIHWHLNVGLPGIIMGLLGLGIIVLLLRIKKKGVTAWSQLE